MTIDRYVLVDKNDVEQDFEYTDYDEALAAARKYNGEFAVIEREYIYSDSDLIWTPEGCDSWPPRRTKEGKTG